MTLVEIPSGSFTMGSRAFDADSHERPPHTVVIGRSFFMATTEVTQAQWNAVMGTDPSRFRGDDLPVERVTWHYAMEFIRRLNLEERGMRYRLPTEAEWEYACRAGTMGLHGDDLDLVAWHADNSGGTSHPVGRKQANFMGLYDMLGNVYEWCEDWKGDYPSGHVTDPRGPPDGFGRVVRGGSWQVHANRVRPDFRDQLAPDERRADVGFRVVADRRAP
jgi:formylglycine-generating enzyme required for sulfatase activity